MNIAHEYLEIPRPAYSENLDTNQNANMFALQKYPKTTAPVSNLTPFAIAKSHNVQSKNVTQNPE